MFDFSSVIRQNANEVMCDSHFHLTVEKSHMSVDINIS